MSVNKLRVNFVRRAVPKRGSFDTDQYNASMEEVSVDLANIGTRWNEEAYPVLSTIPQGDEDESGGASARWPLASDVPDPFADGFDGAHFFVDNDAALTLDDSLFWDDTKKRPKTIKELDIYLNDRITDIFDELSEDIAAVSNGLSDEQWVRLGKRVKDGVSTSAATSADGKATDAQTKSNSLIADLYNSSTTLGTLSTNTIEDFINALMELHDGDFGQTAGDLSVSHATATGITQAGVDKSSSYTELNRGASVTTLEHDLNRIRYELARIKFGASQVASDWDNDPTNDPVTGTAGCLEDHVQAVGDGSPAAKNPHGAARNNIDGVDTEFGYIQSFIGKADGNNTPAYSTTNYLVNGDSLETAIGKLDTQLKATNDEASYIQSFIGKAVGVDTTSYTEENYITDGDTLELAIDQLDQALDDTDTLVSSHTDELSYINVFLGKSSGNEMPTYTSTRHVSVNDAVETAISKLDATACKRLETTFTGHTDYTSPITVTHNMGISFPLVQVIDRGSDFDYSGWLADENYEYERELGLTTSEDFVSIEYLNANQFKIYTSIVNGTIVAVF